MGLNGSGLGLMIFVKVRVPGLTITISNEITANAHLATMATFLGCTVDTLVFV